MSITEEIQPAELAQYASELNEAVEHLCASSAFRTSPKSCEFLRHIVRHTLNDDVAELKERLIGMALLGREATYDTGSDAGVRVRANDVRKRLVAHYKVPDAGARFLFELPTGSYVPRFFRTIPIAEPMSEPRISETPRIYSQDLAPLSLSWLAAPTLVALFLCTICLRWQVAQEHPFTSFWQNVFQNHHVTLCLAPTKNPNGGDLVAMRELNAADPLFDLAGQFHTRLTLTSSVPGSAAPGEILVSVGAIATDIPGETAASGGDRLAIADTPAGRRILDRSTQDNHLSPVDHAALLTISNGPQRSIRIDGTDDEAIQSLVQMLCERDNFPASVAGTLEDNAVTQVVFPLAPGADAMVFHEPLPLNQNKVLAQR